MSFPPAALAWQSTIEKLQSDLQAARDADDDVQIASVQFNLGDAYLVNGQPNLAIESYNEALQINESKGNNNAIAIISSGLGKAYQDLNQFSTSVEYFNRAIQAYQSMGKKRELAGEYINLANTRSYSGQYAESNSAAEIGLELAKELQDANLLKTFYLLMSENHRELGNTEEAAASFEQYSIWKNQLDRAAIDNQTRQAQQAQQALSQRDQQLEETNRELDSSSAELSQA
ncbi:MAG: tetratricopeptide repeat protein, partial [Bacteroidota bacterium]